MLSGNQNHSETPPQPHRNGRHHEGGSESGSVTTRRHRNSNAPTLRVGSGGGKPPPELALQSLPRDGRGPSPCRGRSGLLFTRTPRTLSFHLHPASSPQPRVRLTCAVCTSFCPLVPHSTHSPTALKKMTISVIFIFP